MVDPRAVSVGSKSKAPKIGVKSVPTFRFDDGHVVEFWPTIGVPGFTHKVLVRGPATNNQNVRDWLGDNAKPNQKSARYFHEKHALRAGK